MKKLELNQMEIVEAGGCNGTGWLGFGLVALASVGVIVAVASGGTMLPVLLTMAGKVAVAATTASGLGAMADGCN